MTKTAVVIFNLGGPDHESAIEPFLFNLFNDPYIISLPGIVRTPLAKLISKTRTPKVKPIYAEMGGSSPIQKNTLAQAHALEKSLKSKNFRVFTAQRYWHPMVDEVVQQVREWKADKIILLPLYPQLSSTTTSSFMSVWNKAAQKHDLDLPTKLICCYPTAPGFIKAQAELIRPYLKQAKKKGAPRILFSAHGLPKKIVEQRGDPYPIHVQRSAAAIAKELAEPELDWVVSYQSRVGPVEWIKPYTEPEIIRAGKEKVPLIIVPLAFVSEHLETLVELDVEYKHVADEAGVPYYGRVPTVGVDPAFITELKNLVLTASKEKKDILPPNGRRYCPHNCNACPNSLN